MDQSCVLPYIVNTFAGLGTYPILSPYLCIPNFGTTSGPARNKAYFIVAADPLSLVLAKPPSEIGADVVVGSMQRFGVPMWPPSGSWSRSQWGWWGQRVTSHIHRKCHAMKSPVDAMKCHKCLEIP